MTVVLGLMVVIAAPRVYNGFQGANLKTGVKRFASSLRAARSFAVARRAVVRVQVDLGTGTAQFNVRYPSGGGAGSGQGGSAPSDPGTMPGDESKGSGGGGDYVPEFLSGDFNLPEGIYFSQFLIEADDYIPDEAGQLLFSPRGSSTGGVFIISMESGVGYAVSVNRITGRVYVEAVS